MPLQYSKLQASSDHDCTRTQFILDLHARQAAIRSIQVLAVVENIVDLLLWEKRLSLEILNQLLTHKICKEVISSTIIV